MLDRFSGSIITVAVAAAGAVISVSHHADAGSGASSFRHGADASFSAENTLGRTGPSGNLD
jgi:hypothetical protein